MYIFIHQDLFSNRKMLLWLETFANYRGNV